MEYPLIESHQKYWVSLVNRIHGDGERLTGIDRQHYILNWFCRKLFRSGMIPYLEDSWPDLDDVTVAIANFGFPEIAVATMACSKILFGSGPITQDLVDRIVGDMYPGEDDENYEERIALAESIDTRISETIRPLYPEIERLQAVVIEDGLQRGLYSSV